MQTSTATVPSSEAPTRLSSRVSAATDLAPGLALCAAATAAAMGINAFIPTVSPLLIAIVLGAVVANVVDLPQRVRPGLSFSAKRLLRVGIALLGLQLLLADVLGLGWKVIVVVIAVVASESRERCSSADYSGSPGPSAS